MLLSQLIFSTKRVSAFCFNIAIAASLHLCSSASFAQKLTFNQISVEQGLSQNTVLSIAQDARGFVWMGTRYGLNRFNGHSFNIYKNNPADSNSLSNNYINALLCDSKKNFWIGTEKGLNLFDAETNRFQKVQLPVDGKKILGDISSIYEDKYGTLWIGAEDYLFRSLPGSMQFELVTTNNNVSLLKGCIIKCIYGDSDGLLWIATTNGLVQLQRTNKHFSSKGFQNEAGNSSSLSDNYTTAITEDHIGNLWVGSINGLNLFNKSTETFTRFNAGDPAGIINNNIRKLLSDKDGNLWIGTQEGVSIMSVATRKCRSYQNNADDEKSLSQNSVHSIFEDKNGSVWVGTFFGGVNISYKYRTGFTVWRHSTALSGISNNVVSSIITDSRNNLWVGTEGGGLNFVDRASGYVKIYKHNPGNSSSLGSNLVKTLYIDRDKNLWVGTHGGGLNFFNASSQNFQSYFINDTENSRKQSEIVSIIEDSENNFWVGKHSGLYVFNRKGTSLTQAAYQPFLQKLTNSTISYLIEDRKRNIWIGTFNGLYRFNLNNKTLQLIDLHAGNEVSNINCLKEDSNGNIWIGFHYGGLAKYDTRTNIISYYGLKDGLPNDNVLGILEDNDEQLWLSTGNGLVKFIPSEKKIHTYTASDGLAGNEFNYNAFFKSPTGELFFGGMNGFTGFSPADITTNKDVAPLVFTGLKIFNNKVEINDDYDLLTKDINYTNELQFGYNQHTFTIEFAVLNYIKSSKNKYAYKLEGASNEWSEITQPFATFTNLAEGNYTLWVKGSNNDGVWGEPAKMKINIPPPLWKSWWAFLIYTILLVTVLFFVTRYFYLQALLARDKELHRVKLNFFTNISHEIRTHLTLIMTPVERMEKEHAHNAVLSHQLSNIKNNAERLLKLVTELMDFRKAETNHLKLFVEKQDLVAFLNHVYASFEDLSLAKNISISFVHNNPSIILYFDKEQMEKVIYNLLTNAFKFTPNGGKILLNVEEGEDKVSIQVIDNGRGIAPEYIDNLFTNFFQVNDHSKQNTGYGIGLALSKNITELHKGTLSVESKTENATENNRTCFTLTLLKGVSHFTKAQLANHIVFENKMDDNESKIASASRYEKETTVSKGPNTILIVEDNAELRLIIKESLQQYYKILEADNGLTGKELALTEIPDIVISDVMMPEMDGFELCKHLKTDQKTSHIPVILLTAKTSQSDHVSGLTTGADLYLTKPFSTQVLELNVRNLLQTRETLAKKYSKNVLLQPSNLVVTNTEELFLNNLIGIIEENIDNPEFGVDMLALKAAMSQSVLYKKLKALTEMSVNDFIKSIRLKRAAQLLSQKNLSVYEVCYMVGFSDRKYFSKEFKKQFGKTPSEYKMSVEASL